MLGGCAGSQSTPIKTPVTELVLTVGSLPFPGFVVERSSPSAGYYSNKRLAGKDLSLLRELDSAGRLTGFEVDFDRAASPQQAVGPVVIESSASTYRTAKGAATGLRLLAQQARAEGGVQISTGRLGDGGVGFTLQKQFAGTSYEAFILAWRQNNVVGGIQIEGNAATLDISYALTLADLQQRLIGAA